MDRTGLEVDGTKCGGYGTESRSRPNGQIVEGDLKFDGRVILYIMKGRSYVLRIKVFMLISP